MNQLPHSDGSPGSAGDGLQPGAAPGCLTCCTDTAGCCRPSAPQLLPDRLTEQVCSAAMSLRTGWIRSGLKHVTIHHVSGLSFIKRINQPVCGSTLSLPLSPFFFLQFINYAQAPEGIPRFTHDAAQTQGVPHCPTPSGTVLYICSVSKTNTPTSWRTFHFFVSLVFLVDESLFLDMRPEWSKHQRQWSMCHIRKVTHVRDKKHINTFATVWMFVWAWLETTWLLILITVTPIIQKISRYPKYLYKCDWNSHISSFLLTSKASLISCAFKNKVLSILVVNTTLTRCSI